MSKAPTVAGDWTTAGIVRQEVTLALAPGKKVIPVLFDYTPVPPAERLPEPLKALANRDALTLRGKTYEYHTQRRELVRLLANVPGVREPFPEVGRGRCGRRRRAAAGPR